MFYWLVRLGYVRLLFVAEIQRGVFDQVLTSTTVWTRSNIKCTTSALCPCTRGYTLNLVSGLGTTSQGCPLYGKMRFLWIVIAHFSLRTQTKCMAESTAIYVGCCRRLDFYLFHRFRRTGRVSHSIDIVSYTTVDNSTPWRHDVMLTPWRHYVYNNDIVTELVQWFDYSVDKTYRWVDCSLLL